MTITLVPTSAPDRIDAIITRETQTGAYTKASLQELALDSSYLALFGRGFEPREVSRS